MPDRRQIGEGRRRRRSRLHSVGHESRLCVGGVVVAPYQTELHGYVSLCVGAGCKWKILLFALLAIV